MNIQVVGSENSQENKSSDPFPKSQSVEGNALFEIEKKSIGQVFGLSDHENSQYSDEIGTLLSYAKSQTQDHSPESLKWTIRSLELKLGTPPFGENRLKFVRNYAYLLLQEKRIAEDKKKYERI